MSTASPAGGIAASFGAAKRRGAHPDNPAPNENARADLSALGNFQAAFARALLAEPGEATTHPGVRELAAQPAFRIYRNTFLKACIDALAANYPAVARLVGEQWFRAAAAVYVRRMPPTDPLLVAYGREFAEFLGEFGPAGDYPYLAGVARLDRSWTEAHIACAQRPLAASALAGCTPDELAALVLQPLPSARWHWFEHAPIFTIWSRNRSDEALDAPLDWHAEGALLLRPEGSVQWLPLDAGGCAFLDACARGRTLAQAAAAAMEVDAACDVTRLLGNLLGAGVFAATVADTRKGDCP